MANLKGKEYLSGLELNWVFCIDESQKRKGSS